MKEVGKMRRFLSNLKRLIKFFPAATRKKILAFLNEVLVALAVTIIVNFLVFFLKG